MTIDDKTKDEKLHYHINRKAAKISALSSGEKDQYDILQVKKYCHLIKVKQQNKLSLYIILSGNHLKNTKRH